MLETWFLFLVCKKGQKEDKSEFETKSVKIIVTITLCKNNTLTVKKHHHFVLNFNFFVKITNFDLLCKSKNMVGHFKKAYLHRLIKIQSSRTLNLTRTRKRSQLIVLTSCLSGFNHWAAVFTTQKPAWWRVAMLIIPKFPCRTCAKYVHDKGKAVQYQLCEHKIHIKCINLNYLD